MAEEKMLHDVIRKLRKASADLRERKPWEVLGSAQLLAVRDPGTNENIYYSCLGSDGQAHGVMIYEGREGLDSFLLGQDSFAAGVPYETVLLHETAMVCYLGGPGELTADQKLKLYLVGSSAEPEDGWTCFRTLKMGRGAQLPTAEEADRFVRFLHLFQEALDDYKEKKPQPDYEAGDVYVYDPERGTGEIEPGLLYAGMPHYIVQVPVIPEELLQALRSQPRTEAVLQCSVFALGLCLRDNQIGQLSYPTAALAASEDGADIYGSARGLGELGAQEVLILALAEAFMDAGLPRKLLAGDQLAYASAKQLCDPLNIPVELQPLPVMRELEIKFKRTLGLD